MSHMLYLIYKIKFKAHKTLLSFLENRLVIRSPDFHDGNGLYLLVTLGNTLLSFSDVHAINVSFSEVIWPKEKSS